jgi:hypothetical protein
MKPEAEPPVNSRTSDVSRNFVFPCCSIVWLSVCDRGGLALARGRLILSVTSRLPSKLAQTSALCRRGTTCHHRCTVVGDISSPEEGYLARALSHRDPSWRLRFRQCARRGFAEAVAATTMPAARFSVRGRRPVVLGRTPSVSFSRLICNSGA